MEPKIITELPGPKARAIIEKDNKLLMGSNWRYLPFVPKRGQGVYVEDVDGNIFLDLVSGAAVLNVGINDESLYEAIVAQAKELVYSAIPGYFYHGLVNELAEKLIRITPGSFEKRVFFGLSGADATDIAMKIARYATGRYRFINFTGANHGLGTYGSTSLQGLSSLMVRGFGPMIPGVSTVPYPYPYRCAFGDKCQDCEMQVLTYLEDNLFKTTIPPDEVAAIFVEPIQGDGGVLVPSQKFLKGLKDICDRYSILLVADEVQTGFGRTGKMFALQHFGINSDLMLLGKPLGNGLPMSACVGREDIMRLPKGSLAITGAGHLLGCASALAAIEIIEKHNLCSNAEKVGHYLLDMFKDMANRHDTIGDVRGLGLLAGIEVVKSRATKEPATEAIAKINSIAFQKGLLSAFDGLRGNVFRVMPPLTITEKDAQIAVEILDESFEIFEASQA